MTVVMFKIFIKKKNKKVSVYIKVYDYD